MKLFGEKADKENVNQAVTDAPAVVVGGGSTKRRGLAKLVSSNIFTSKKLWAVLVIAALVVLSGVAHQIWQSRPVKVGTQTVTKSEINAATVAQRKALQAGGAKGEQLDAATDDAQKQVVLLAALKTEADKRHISYSEADIDVMLKDAFAPYGSKAGYMSYMQRAYGWSQDDVYRSRTIEYLQGKLESSLISTRTYSTMLVRWDNIKVYYPSKFAELYAQKEATLKTDYLPLYAQKASVETLASKAQLVDGLSIDEQYKIFHDNQGIPIIFTQQTFGPGHSIDGFQKYTEGEDMATKLKSLKKIGDYTGPFKSNDGTLVIVRLEKSAGGAYASWDEFTSYYQQKSGLTFGPSTVNQAIGGVKTGAKKLGKTFAPETAYAAGVDCLSTHALNYQIQYRDYNTNALISAANTSVNASTTRDTGNCTTSGYSSRGYSVGAVNSNNAYSVSKTFSDNNAGTMSVLLDCNGPSWSISNTNTGVVITINGYTHKSTTFAAGQSNAYPFFSGANGSPAFVTVVKYAKDAPAAGNISCAANSTNFTVTFNYSNAPNGAIIKKDGATWMTYSATTMTTTNVADNGYPGNTTHTYTLQGGGVNLDSASCTTTPPSGTNSVTCSANSSSTSVSFSWVNVNSGSQANLRRDSSTASPVASGAAGQASGSGSYNDTNVSPGATHTYYLTGNGTILAQQSCTTPNSPPICDCSCSGTCPQPGNGSITCGGATQNTINLSYNYSGTSSGVKIYKGIFPDTFTSQIGQDSSTSNTSTLPATGLSPGTTYNFALVDASTGTQYGPTVTCATTNPVPFTVTGGSTVTLNDDESPTAYSSGGSYTINASSNKNISMSCSIYTTKNGAVIGGPTDCSGSRATNTVISVTGPSGPTSGSAGDQFCTYLTVSPGSGTINDDGTVSNPGSIPPFVGCATVANLPFFKIFNSSVTTGGDIGTCSATTGTLAGWYNNGTANTGASAQLGAYALANIAGFASNQTGSRPATGLSFSNTAGLGTPDNRSPLLGGILNGNNCITALAKPGAKNSALTTASTNINTLLNPASGPSYTFTGNLDLSNPSGQEIDADKSLGVYVNGDVYIEDDITYDQNTSNWALGKIPSFVLSVTGGDIYIDAGVLHLDGTYEAQAVRQPDGTMRGGNIYTCADGFRRMPKADLYTKCTKQLKIVGSFVANKIELLRTVGTLHNETVSPGVNCANAVQLSNGLRPTCAAEVFEFNPAHYLERPAAAGASGGAVRYDAISSLPPVL